MRTALLATLKADPRGPFQQGAGAPAQRLLDLSLLEHQGGGDMESPSHPFSFIRVDENRPASEESSYPRAPSIARTKGHIVATEISQAKRVDWRGGGIK